MQWICFMIKLWSVMCSRFWKLNLQILARYYTWVGEALEQKWPSESLALNTVSDTSCSARLQFLVHLYTDVNRLVARLPSLLDSVTVSLGSLSQQGQELLKSEWNVMISLILILPLLYEEQFHSVEIALLVTLRTSLPSVQCGIT
jgi:hypothetical protein